MTLHWQTTPEDAFGAMTDAYIIAIQEAVYQLALRRAPEIEAWMKVHAPWTDRTGNARQTLHAEAERLAHEAVRIQMDHGMDYGIFLELANAGRFSIIGPALDHFAPIVWGDVLALLS